MSMQRRVECFFSPILLGTVFVWTDLTAAEIAKINDIDANHRPAFIEEMLVTAQKREQLLQDVPIAMSAFSQTALDDLGVVNLQQLSTFIPGIHVQEQSVTFTGISIRGVTSDNTAPSQAPRVSVFQNGVDISRARGANTALYDLERVEALRGPQGTLFGRGAEVGALSTHQRGAEDEFSASVELGAESFNGHKFEGHVNVASDDGGSAARLAVYRHKRDGYVDNAAGGTLAGVDTSAARLAFSWQASDAMSWQSWINYQEDSPEGTPFISFYYPENDRYSEANVDAGPRSGSARTLWDATVRGDYSFANSLSLTSISAYRTFDTQENFDADGLSLPVLEYENAAEHQQFSQELRLNFDSGERWQGFAGLNYQWEKGTQELTEVFHEGYLMMLPKLQAVLMSPDQPFDTELLRQAPPLYEPYAPLTHIAGFPLNPNLTEIQYDKTENHSADLFADGTYVLTDRWQISAGLRLSYEDLSTSITTPEPPSAATLSMLPQTCVDGFLLQAACGQQGQLQARKLTQSDQFWGASGRLLTRYELKPNWINYASYTRGRRPHVLAYDIHSSEDNLTSETVDSFELGSKWQSQDQRYTLNAAAFYFRYNNFVTAENSRMPIVVLSDNGKAVSQGLELDGRAALNDNWSVFANIAYNDARITEGSYDGDRFRMAPLWSGAAGISQLHDWGALGRGLLTLSYSYQSKVFFDDNNDSNFGQNSQSSYGLANILYQLDSANDHWQLKLWVNNLFDQEYIIDAGNTGALFGLNTYVPGAPRMMGGSVGYTF